MLEALPQWLVDEWMKWYDFHNLVGETVDPEFRADARTAKGFATLANHLRDKEPLDLRDLLPFPPPKPAPSPEQLQMALIARSNVKAKPRAKRAKTEKEESSVAAPADSPGKTHFRPRRNQKGRRNSTDGAGGDQ